MVLRSRHAGCVLAALLSLIASTAPVAQLSSPKAHFEAVFDGVVDAVAAANASVAQDAIECAMIAIVDQHLRQEFNLHRSSRLILTQRYWPEDPAEQDRFVDAFYGWLLETYGDVLKHVDAETLRFKDLPREVSADVPLTLESDMRITSGDDDETVDVGFVMRYTNGAWKIHDVEAPDYSFARGFRDEFLYEIADVGLDGLIGRFEQEAARIRPCLA